MFRQAWLLCDWWALSKALIWGTVARHAEGAKLEVAYMYTFICPSSHSLTGVSIDLLAGF
jgi:hypothetical protein